MGAATPHVRVSRVGRRGNRRGAEGSGAPGGGGRKERAERKPCARSSSRGPRRKDPAGERLFGDGEGGSEEGRGPTPDPREEGIPPTGTAVT